MPPSLRIAIAIIGVVPAIFIAWLAFALNGYEEDYGTGKFETLPFAIPWSIATAILVVMIVGAVSSPFRRERWSRWAISLTLLMAAVILVPVVLNA